MFTITDCTSPHINPYCIDRPIFQFKNYLNNNKNNEGRIRVMEVSTNIIVSIIEIINCWFNFET